MICGKEERWTSDKKYKGKKKKDFQRTTAIFSPIDTRRRENNENSVIRLKTIMNFLDQYDLSYASVTFTCLQERIKTR